MSICKWITDKYIGIMALPRRTSLRCFLLVIMFCLSSVFADAGLVLRTNALTVKVGRTVYLNTDDIVIKNMKRGDEGCRVEVVEKDPITQRVGELEPKVGTIFLYFFLGANLHTPPYFPSVS